jgi:hypothetical protein
MHKHRHETLVAPDQPAPTDTAAAASRGEACEGTS